jgi:ribonuclease VapC
VLAVLLRERGAGRVIEALPESVVCSVNLVEIVTRLIDDGVSPEHLDAALAPFTKVCRDFTLPVALAAGRMRAATRHRGLSLGDRACLALARALGATAMTADRAWEGLDVGVAIEVVR